LPLPLPTQPPCQRSTMGRVGPSPSPDRAASGGFPSESPGGRRAPGVWREEARGRPSAFPSTARPVPGGGASHIRGGKALGCVIRVPSGRSRAAAALPRAPPSPGARSMWRRMPRGRPPRSDPPLPFPRVLAGAVRPTRAEVHGRRLHARDEPRPVAVRPEYGRRPRGRPGAFPCTARSVPGVALRIFGAVPTWLRFAPSTS
jgi:hypothetical protein